MQLSTQRGQSPAHQVRGQVSDQTHGVRQFHAVGKSRATLVVNEQEGEPVRTVGGGHAQDPRLQELGLSGTCGSTHQGVRTFGLQIQVHGFHALGTHQCPQGTLVLAVLHGPGGNRVVFQPPIGNAGGAFHQIVAGECHIGHAPRKVRIVVDRRSGVNHGCHHAGQLGGQVQADAFTAHGVRQLAQTDLAGGGGFGNMDKVAARSR